MQNALKKRICSTCARCRQRGVCVCKVIRLILINKANSFVLLVVKKKETVLLNLYPLPTALRTQANRIANNNKANNYWLRRKKGSVLNFVLQSKYNQIYYWSK
jgi:hypothetical protein